MTESIRNLSVCNFTIEFSHIMLYTSIQLCTVDISVDLCYGFLSRRWYDQHGCEERSAQCNILLDELLNGYFKDAKLSFIRDHATWINTEIDTFAKNNKKAAFKTFPCFTKYSI